MKAITILFCLFCLTCSAQKTIITDPTGSYVLASKTKEINGEQYGYTGEIKIKKISSSKIVVYLFVCKGAPSYNSGTAYDTLTIKKNVAVYKSEYDASCRIYFRFNTKGVQVEEKTDNQAFGCGFGHAVYANGFYKKTSNKIPTRKELANF